MKKPHRLITHPSELDSLSVLPILRRPGQKRVAIAEHLISSPQREQFETELNRHLFACGCQAGAIGVVLAAVAYAVWAFVAAPDIGLLGHIGRGLAAVVIGGLLGKMAGLFSAENRLKHTVADLRRAIPPTAVVKRPPLSKAMNCY
jgi:hypothetical protein